MIGNLQTLINQAGGKLEVVIRHIDGGGFQAELNAVDSTGIMAKVANETVFYPWTAIKRVRVKE